MTDPTPNGQTWRCGRTDPHTPHASYADHEKLCPGIPRPVPPAPSRRDPELAAALNEQRRQSYNAETRRTRPAPSSDTPADERPVWFWDPASNEEMRLTVREAAAVILALQDQQTRDPAWEDVRDDEATPVREWLRLALDGEGYAEHVLNCVLPRYDEPHPFTPAADGYCTVCFQVVDDGPHPARPAAPVDGPVLDERLRELAGWLATCAADTLAYIEAGHRVSHAEPVGDRCLTDCTEAWYVERDTLRAAIADVRALLAAADRGEPTP